MKKLRLLAQFEERATREELDTDAFKLFLLLLANYDDRNQHGEIHVCAVAAAFGERFSFPGFTRACSRLISLGLIERIPSRQSGVVGEKPVMVYHIPRRT